MQGKLVRNKVALKPNVVSNKTESGLVLATGSHDYFDTWLVVGVGPDVEEIKVGDAVCVDFTDINKGSSRIMSQVATENGFEAITFLEANRITAIVEY